MQGGKFYIIEIGGTGNIMTKTQNQIKNCKKIEDLELIKKYNSMDLYIPPHETSATFDNEMLNRNAFGNSEKIIGQHRPIEVAIWEDDPEKNSPNAWNRIHLRIIDGRHRYRSNQKWKRKYHDLSKAPEPVLVYYDLRLHFDMQKKSKPEERIALIEQLGEYLMKEKGIPMHKVCNEIVKMWVPQGIASDVWIRRLCPQKFKDLPHSLNRKNKTFEATGQKSRSKIALMKEMYEEKLKEADEKISQEKKQKEYFERKYISMKQKYHEKNSALEELQKQYRKIKSLETTVTIDNIKIHARVDATFGKLVVEKAK